MCELSYVRLSHTSCVSPKWPQDVQSASAQSFCTLHRGCAVQSSQGPGGILSPRPDEVLLGLRQTHLQVISFFNSGTRLFFI